MALLAWQRRALQSSQLRISASTGQVALDLCPRSLAGLQSCWQPFAAWQVLNPDQSCSPWSGLHPLTCIVQAWRLGSAVIGLGSSCSRFCWPAAACAASSRWRGIFVHPTRLGVEQCSASMSPQHPPRAWCGPDHVLQPMQAPCSPAAQADIQAHTLSGCWIPRTCCRLSWTCRGLPETARMRGPPCRLPCSWSFPWPAPCHQTLRCGVAGSGCRARQPLQPHADRPAAQAPAGPASHAQDLLQALSRTWCGHPTPGTCCRLSAGPGVGLHYLLVEAVTCCHSTPHTARKSSVQRVVAALHCRHLTLSTELGPRWESLPKRLHKSCTVYCGTPP